MIDIINVEFKNKVNNFRSFLSTLEEECLLFDKQHQQKKERISFVLDNQEKWTVEFNSFFTDVWKFVSKLSKKSFKTYQEYFQSMLGSPLLKAEINKYIKEKPLGYPGDFVMMNYIFDFQTTYLGQSSLDIFINYYTTHIPISQSNIKRKNYFKSVVAEVANNTENAKITSVGCGSSRELIELVQEGKINRPLTFSCVDFESKALDFIKGSLDKIDSEKKRFLKVDYFKVDIRDLMDNIEFKSKIEEQDLVYASGLFDYLGKHLIKKIVPVMFNSVKAKGHLIIVNAGLKDSEFRSYYELLGEWKFHHRTEEEIEGFVPENIKEKENVVLEKFSFPMNYVFLKIKKNKS